MSATIKGCLVQLHCYVSGGFTFSHVCLRCCKETRGKRRRLDNAVAGTSKIQSFFVTTTAAEDTNSEGNPENSNVDVVGVAPPVPAPDDEAAAELAVAEQAPRGPVVQELYLTLDNRRIALSFSGAHGQAN